MAMTTGSRTRSRTLDRLGTIHLRSAPSKMSSQKYSQISRRMLLSSSGGMSVLRGRERDAIAVAADELSNSISVLIPSVQGGRRERAVTHRVEKRAVAGQHGQFFFDCSRRADRDDESVLAVSQNVGTAGIR